MYSDTTSGTWTLYPTTTYPCGRYVTITCPACNGERVQMRSDGIRILCPACGGSGVHTYYKEDYYPWHSDPPIITYHYNCC